MRKKSTIKKYPTLIRIYLYPNVPIWLQRIQNNLCNLFLLCDTEGVSLNYLCRNHSYNWSPNSILLSLCWEIWEWAKWCNIWRKRSKVESLFLWIPTILYFNREKSVFFRYFSHNINIFLEDLITNGFRRLGYLPE